MKLEEVRSIADGLWSNGRDSIRHALDHFSERGIDSARARRRHHDKWIVLSVYQAAECICNMRLLELDPECPLFIRRNDLYFPSLERTLKALQAKGDVLAPAERQLFILLSELPDLRHQFMHRIAPADIDVSIAAMCMMGLLKHIDRTRGEAASDIVWQSSPVEGDVVAAIRSTRLQEYGDFVALFLREKYGDQWRPACPACDVRAVVSGKCEACFTELTSVRCRDCGEDLYYVSLEYAARGTAEVECQHCGYTGSV